MAVSDSALRARVLELLEQRMRFGNGTITRDELAAFDVDGLALPLIDRGRGIRNPRQMEATLSVVSSAEGPYSDAEIAPGIWRYDYQSRSDGGDNTKLRRAFELGLPIILLRRIANGVFVPEFPVYVVADDQAGHFFTIAVQEQAQLGGEVDSDTRSYVERVVSQRVHQREFRGKVLRAYDDHCAVCRLNHPELLDAAHILSDRHERGLAIVSNGLSLCKIHHSAYDLNLLGIDGDYRVHINENLLREKDGPMLKHGLQEMHGSTILTPSQSANRPDREHLLERFAQFRSAS